MITTLLAADFSTFSDAFAQMDILTHPEKLVANLQKMPLILASVVLVVGAMCTLNGYRWHKWVVIALAFLLGLAVGHILSQQMGKSVIVAVALGVLFATIATPMLRWTVAVFGGLTGAFLGANAWVLSHAQPANAIWAGACMGFIALALMSFVVFRLVVVLFTSIGGAAMVVLGAITCLMNVPGWEQTVKNTFTANQYLIPLLVTTAAVAGFVIQESRVRASGGGGGDKKPAKAG